MQPVILQNETLRLTVLPGLGACIAGFELRHRGFWLPIMRPMPLAAAMQGSSPDSSSYILAPYSNRIRAGRFSFAGKEHRLAANWPDGQTIHGEVHGRPWSVVAQSATGLVCRFEAGEGLNFPFAYQVEAGFSLEENRLRLDLELTNTGLEPMPAGLGHHPYFMRWLGSPGELALGFGAERVYLTDATCLPSQPAVPLPPAFDFRQPRPLGEQFFDHVFAGWDGALSLVGDTLSLHLSADPVFSHLVVFTAPDGTVALEPVTHATDGFNLMNRPGFGDVGVRVLEPGQKLGGRVQIRLEAP